MSDYVLSEAVASSRLVQALKKVSRNVTREVIRKARQSNTPVVFQDEHGNILELDPNELARQYGIED
jgi:hypothetical protein